MDNLQFYNSVRQVPDTGKKSIGAGRLKGMTDINPMWRIKVLTEQCGPCGFGWRYEITKQWLEAAGNETKAFCNINLYIKIGEEWSHAIPGTGGSSFIAMERNGPYVSDECYKMALTDAISVAAKALGVGADVYFSKDVPYNSKYENIPPQPQSQNTPPAPQPQQAYTPEIQQAIEMAVANINAASTSQEVSQIWQELSALKQYPEFKSAVAKRGSELKKQGL